MYSEKAIKSLNALLAGDIERGITTEMVKHLRGGHAPYIMQETWLVLANFLEGGCKQLPNRPPTGESREIRNRNLTIKQEYRQIMAQGETQKHAYDILAKKYGLGEKSIHTIITHR